jgi:hypothetical protein
MSDTLTNKIQTSNPNDLPGGQLPLSPDAAAGRVRGTDQSQNTLSFSRGAEVAASSQPIASKNNLSNGLGVTGVAVSVTPTDRRTIEGSTPGDSRSKPGDVAAASLLAVSGSNKGPREAVGQFPNGKFCKDAPAPVSFPPNADSEAGN